MDKIDIGEMVAEMFTDAALRNMRPSCRCDIPEPGVWSALYWTTCQQCQKQLSKLQLLNRG